MGILIPSTYYAKESQEKYKRKENGTLLLSKFQSRFSASGSQDKRQQLNNSGSRSGGSDRGSLGNTARGKEQEENQRARAAQIDSLSPHFYHLLEQGKVEESPSTSRSYDCMDRNKLSSE